MDRQTQCPNCISYRVVILRRAHYAIFLIVSAIAGITGGLALLTGSDYELMGVITVFGTFVFSAIALMLVVKIFLYKKPDAFCLKCRFRFNLGK